MDYLNRYLRRSQRNGVTSKEKMVNEVKRNFKKHLEESPSAFEVQATIPEEVNITDDTRKIRCMINNITLNDQRVLDEKYLHVEVDEDIDIGCYVLWQNSHWLIMFREHNSIESHKTFTMRRCNQIIKHRWNSKIWEIPVSIENLTMYSDGLSDGQLISQPDPKRHISYGSNPVTKTINTGHRIMLGKKTVFRVTHLNDFEYNSAYTGAEGLIKALVLQTTLITKDDVVNSVAWNEIENIVGVLPEKINGSNKIIFSSSKAYTYESDVNIKWSSPSALVTLAPNGNQCKVIVVNDITKVGSKFTLKVLNLDTDELLDEKEITITGFI